MIEKLKRNRVVFIAVGIALLWFVFGFFAAKGIYDKPLETKVKRDTVTHWDTIPHWYPVPVETKPQMPQYKWLTRVQTNTDTMMLHDSVLVEVPITSKHYHAPEYDAWVSGYEPSLDSIRTYNKTEYITETLTKVVNPKRKPWGIGFHVGYGYDFKSKTAAPFVGVGLSYDIISF